MTGAVCEGSDFEAVGAIKDSFGYHPYRCSAVRIACGVFLSAAHCGPSNTTANGQYTTWFQDKDGNRTVLWDEAVIPDAYWPPDNSSAALSSKIRDIALYFGREEDCSSLPTAVLPALPDDEVASGTVLSDLTLVGIGSFISGSSGLCHPGDGTCRYEEGAGTAVANTLRVNNAQSGPGDSGGPLFLGPPLDHGVAPKVIGVLSAAEGNCEVGTSYYTSLLWSGNASLEAPVDWIRRELAERDPDGDGYYTPIDRCEGWDDNDNADGDFLPDGCDPCPYEPHPVEIADPDNDEICNINAPDGSGDNCPTVANPDQKNTNLVVEIANDAAQVGDKCEPVPQPVFEPQEQLEQSNYECHAIGHGGIGYTVCWSRYALASDGPNLTFNPRGSFNLKPQPPITDEASGGEEHQVPVLQTDFRYCVHHPPDANCFAPTAIDESYLSTSLGDEDEASLFHRVRVSDVPPLHSSMGLATYATSQPEKNLAWDWVSDFDRWRSGWGSSWVPDPEPGLDVNSLDRGRFWMHGVTDVGMKNASASWKTTTGVHPSNVDPDGAEHLANHYVDVFPTNDRATWDAHKIIYIEPETFWQRPCFDCGEINPEDLLDLYGDPIDERAWFNQFESRLITKLGDDVGVVLPDGRAVLLSEERVSASVRQFLGGNDPIVPYCEANPRLRNGQQAADFLVVAEDGTNIITPIFARGMRFATPVRAEAMLTSTEEQSEPSPRTDFVPVYSRSTARLFVIGGTESATGELTGEIWQQATTELDGWSRLPLTDYTPGKVLAATYSYRDNHLWILDEVTHGRHLSKARLTRVQAGTGEAEVLGTWPRLKLFESHWMMLDRDGSVLLFASSSRTRAHWVFKLDPDSGGLVGMRRRNGMLAVRPSVDMDGYSFLVQSRASQPPTVVRRADLHLVPTGWLVIGQCL